MEILSSHPVAVDHFESRFRCWRWAGFARGGGDGAAGVSGARGGGGGFGLSSGGGVILVSVCVSSTGGSGSGISSGCSESFFRLSWILKSIALAFLRHDDFACLRARARAKTSSWAGDRIERPDFGGAGDSSIVYILKPDF